MCPWTNNAYALRLSASEYIQQQDLYRLYQGLEKEVHRTSTGYEQSNKIASSMETHVL